MASFAARPGTYPVGIDLGTTYSSIAYLTPQGQPITIPNSEGELSTPSVVLFDGNDIVVGTEALRNSVTAPERVVQYAKRHMGDPHKCWVFDGKVYRPQEISTFILKKLLNDASVVLGKIRHAVIIVPAQFSELQRRDTVEAGLAAGLERVDIIHEPVAAALCYVLGEGMWFAELANAQTVLVYDLGGGTFDLSIVKYDQKEVRVLASGGHLSLGGLDWNAALEGYACDEFIKTSISDPRLDRESMQALALEVEQAKRSLSVRNRSPLVVQHDGRRKALSIDRDQFEDLTRPLLNQTEQIMRDMLKEHQLGWARIDAILATGGASRMPMIRNMLQRVGGTTLNQTLSPDQSICHGAAYYAGMLLSGSSTGQLTGQSTLDRNASGRLGSFRQQSVSGRALGILVRDLKTQERRPHFLIPANTPLPCAYRQRFGTTIPNQKKVHLHIVESGTDSTSPYVEIGECVIDGMTENLPISSPIEVTIRYDEQARVHVEAIVISSGLSAKTTLLPPSHTVSQTASPPVPLPSKPAARTNPPPAPQRTIPEKQDEFLLLDDDEEMTSPASVIVTAQTRTTSVSGPLPKAKPVRKQQPPVVEKPKEAPAVQSASILNDSSRPIPLCNQCGEVLDARGRCPVCQKTAAESLRKRPVKSGEDAQQTEQIPVVPPQPDIGRPQNPNRPRQK